MTSSKDAGKGEAFGRLDGAVSTAIKGEVLGLGGAVGILARPVKGVSPSTVAEPVADIVSVTGIDKNRHLLEDTRDVALDGLNIVAVLVELVVDVPVAVLEAANLDAESLLDLVLV